MKAKVNAAEKDKVLQSFGDNLRKLREQKELTQEALAFMAGFSRSYYTEVEQGKRNLSLLNISRLANALEIPMSNLLMF